MKKLAFIITPKEGKEKYNLFVLVYRAQDVTVVKISKEDGSHLKTVLNENINILYNDLKEYLAEFGEYAFLKEIKIDTISEEFLNMLRG